MHILCQNSKYDDLATATQRPDGLAVLAVWFQVRVWGALHAHVVSISADMEAILCRQICLAYQSMFILILLYCIIK